MKLESGYRERARPPMPLSKGRWVAEERKQWHLTRYEELKREGKPFFPHTVFKDAVVALLVFLVLVALAVFVGAPLEEPANPSNTEYVPRPEWYFMFLFEMLKYFPGELEWVGVVLVPGVAVGVLFFLPFLDRGTARHPRQRVLVVNLAAFAMLAVAFLTLRSYDVTPTTMVSMITTPPSFSLAAHPAPPARPKLTAGQEKGMQLYQSQNCAMCHQIGGTGSPVGPDLTRVGALRDLGWLHEYLERPGDLNPNATMPAFLPPLSHQEVEWVAQYLSTLR
jgi:mono/diheme cytochrome c family protein